MLFKKKTPGVVGRFIAFQVFKATDNDKYLVTNYLKRWLYLNSLV
jgi:hypothetical protein